MKFGKYLQKAEAPEWKKAYIDYQGLKKLIKAVGISRMGLDFDPLSGRITSVPAKHHLSIVSPHAAERSMERSRSRVELPPLNFSVMNLYPESLREPASIPSVDPSASMQTPEYSFDIRSSRLRHGSTFSDLDKSGSTEGFMHPLAELPLYEIFIQLTPQELAFFAMLNAELDKVESFYVEKEKGMIARGRLLLNQLEELKDHRKLFLEAHTKKAWAARIASILSSTLRPQRNPSEQKEARIFKALGEDCSIDSLSSSNSFAMGKNLSFMTAVPLQNGKRKKKGSEEGNCTGATHSNNPGSYNNAKRKLKKAVLEHYRGLETLHNYRVLNVTGFGKAVKKFQKITGISVKRQYMTEKVGNSALASDEAVSNMIRDMEQMYAAVFFHGDMKEARKELRARTIFKTHHFSTFRSGLLIGLAISGLVDGLVKVFQPETQRAIPSWDILLYLYGLLFVPVLYSFLMGINFLVWARSRINYIFIFDLNVSSHLDYRQYFEIPSLLLATLCLAFWGSFCRIGTSIFQPTTWPLVWLIFAAFLLVEPMPVMAKSSRYWVIKAVLKLFLSGFRPVEFADFWIGDQLCSFVFTLSNSSLFVCVYMDDFSDNWTKCKNSSRTWPIAFGLASIPFIIRLLQSFRRYIDSKIVVHLMNAGKYCTGILSYLFYFMWSHQVSNRGTIFALWCVFNTCYSIYACSWDFLVDFSILQRHSKHIFLRTQLMYPHKWVYYLAMLLNLIIRFLWVIYIPQRGPPMMVRTFITGMFEMLRRLQWNFFRLENEHIGNMDQYRVTREMPLPYALGLEIQEEHRDDESLS